MRKHCTYLCLSLLVNICLVIYRSRYYRYVADLAKNGTESSEGTIDGEIHYINHGDIKHGMENAATLREVNNGK